MPPAADARPAPTIRVGRVPGASVRSLKTEERTRERVRAIAPGRLFRRGRVKRNAPSIIRVVLAPSDGASASGPRDSTRVRGFSIEGCRRLAAALEISTESLILAQDERWRRA